MHALEPRRLLANPITFGGGMFDSGYRIATTPDGGTVVAGLFSGTADFDPTSGRSLLTAVGDSDVFIARYSATGALVWARRFGGEVGDFNQNGFIDIATDPERTKNFDQGVGLYPAELGEYVNAVDVDASGNVFIAGSFRGQAALITPGGSATLNSIGGKSYLDIFLLKLTASGNLSFVRTIGGRFTDVAQGMALDSSNNIYLTGYFSRVCDFDPSSGVHELTTRGREDIFTAKYNANGQLTWVQAADTTEDARTRRSMGSGIGVDSAGNVYVAGVFAGETNFTPGVTPRLVLTPAGETDAYIEKFSSDGTVLWVKNFGGEDFDGATALSMGPDNSFYTGAYFETTIDVDPGPAVRPLIATPEEIGKKPKFTDLLISKFDTADGSLEWAKPISGPKWETLGGIQVDSSGNVYSTGGFYAPTDFNPGRGRALMSGTLGVEDFKDPNDGDRDNSYDVFLQKLDANGQYVASTSFGARSDDWGIGIALNANQQPVVTGQFRGSYSFPPPAPSGAKLRPIGVQDVFDALFGTDLVIV
jgi:hypothetical protein